MLLVNVNTHTKSGSIRSPKNNGLARRPGRLGGGSPSVPGACLVGGSRQAGQAGCHGVGGSGQATRQDRLGAMVLKGVSRPAGRTDWLPGLARAQGQPGVWAASSFWLPVGLLGWKNNHAIQICLPICPRLDYADI